MDRMPDWALFIIAALVIYGPPVAGGLLWGGAGALVGMMFSVFFAAVAGANIPEE